MKFWFCEKCGKRITDADFEAGRAADKQAKGVYCTGCSVGIVTTQIEAVSAETRTSRSGIKPVSRSIDPATISTATTPTGPVPPVLTSGISARNSRLNITPQKPPSDRKGDASRKAPRSSVPYTIGGAALALVVVAIYFLHSSSGQPQTADNSGAMPSSNPTPAAHIVATTEAPARNEPLANPATPLGPHMDPDQQANQAFDQLYSRLKLIDKDEQSAALDQFIATYSNSIVASRARKMLADLKKQETSPPPTKAKPAPKPPATPKPPVTPATPATEPAAPNPAALIAYSEFQAQFLSALRNHDGQRATSLLSQAEKNNALAPKKASLAALQPASDWIAELDNAIPKGAAQLKEADDFTLPVSRGAPIHVGKSAEFKFSEIKDNVIYVVNKGLTLTVPLASLPDNTRAQLMLLGFGEGPHARSLQAFSDLLAATDHKAEAAAVTKLLAGAPEPDAACLQELQELAGGVSREQLAESAWKEVLKLTALEYDAKRNAQIRSAVESFRTGFADSLFASAHASDIADVESLAWEPDPKGLLLHLKMNELQGATVADASGLNNNGTAVNAPQIVPGKFGNALSFNGSNTYVTLPDELLQNHAAFSLSLWFNTTANGVILGQNDPVSPEIPTTHNVTACIGHDGKLYARFHNKGSMHPVAASPLNDGKWHSLTIAVAKGSQNIFIDGAKLNVRGNVELAFGAHWQLGTGFASSTPAIPNGKWFYYKGLLDDVRLYDRTLTDQEALHLAGKRE